ncbi:DUF2782 domain-containing protein [Usitatibacter palustris]|uniref:DUF2782 domain-containing protein n=1 Tax=Usitatibacter palustris TaxID=2732487 RepID=A0A6M4H1L5_9PROT|nr:DUF2782 domain-containing protein [Usitatibacter palustris]QJR13391.1 hypothetical protein DSM104440_00174 [Usitatibacter palustris]
MKRAFIFLVALTAAAGAFAQSGARPIPPGSTALIEPPPLPPLPDVAEPELKPQLTVRKEGDSTITEYRLHGKLYMMRVVPGHGRPYVMVDQKGDGTFSRQDHTLDSGVRVPQWVLVEF